VRTLLDALPLASSRFTFIDLGSGKGRSLLVASERPFERIVGVELMPELHRIAQRNVEVYRSPTQACKNIDLYCMSATEFDFGTEPLVLFMYNPFGRDTLARVLERLEASLRETPREVYIVYGNPVFHDVLQSSSMFRLMSKFGAWWSPWAYVIYRAMPGLKFSPAA
jgi:predicted RNA methylase